MPVEQSSRFPFPKAPGDGRLAAAADGFHIDALHGDGAARLRLRGELDAATAPLLEAGIGEAAARGVSELVVDCSELAFIDSSGLSVLVTNHKRLEDVGCCLVVEAAPPGALRLFEIAGIDRVLIIRDADGPSSK